MDAVAKKRARPAARRASASARADRANPRDTPRDPLAPYRRKRDFSVTAEPSGELAGESTGSFCVQEHAASRLHYDFRLELDGVLKSWAVPKGPSLDPREKRLAVAVEDHPVEYGTFEGVIPEGEYGGGAVLLWDRGLWEPLDDPRRGLARGKLDFVLHGEKLAGRFALIKLKNSDSEWLLVKADDERAQRGRDLLAEQPQSVASGRTIEDIARDQGATPKQLERARAVGASVAGVVLGNADKVLFAESSVTKLDLARYYESVAERILPHVRDRPLTLVRCPDGSAGPCFYQKHVSAGMGPEIATVDIVEDGGKTGKYLVVSTLAGIVAAVQLGALELHVWGSRQGDLERPDRLVFDLDPDPSVPFAEVRRAAAEVRDRLDALGLASFAMVTGGKGVHVVVPLQRTRDFTEVKAFAHGFARAMVADEPRRFVAVATKAKRSGRIFVDYLRNGRGATAICPYSTRARPRAPVAAPVAWGELEHLTGAAPWDLHHVAQEVARGSADPWEAYDDTRQRITVAAMEAVARSRR